MKNLLRLILAVGLLTLLANSFALPPCQGSDSSKWSNCYGKLTWKNGDEYYGDWQNGKRTGKGTYIWADGGKYVGEFKDDSLNGQGTHLTPAGSKYVGELKGDAYNGQGILYLPDGSISESGLWKNNNIVTSQYVDPNTFTRIARSSQGSTNGDDERIERQRSQSRLPACPASGYSDNCFGTFTNDSGFKYVGEWKANKQHGQGAAIFADGDKYVGEFKDGKRNGQGTYTFVDGTTQTGEWRDEKQHGQGITAFFDGRKYVGEYKDHKFSGRGIFYLANGSVSQSGIWNDDKLITSQYIDPNSFTRIAKGSTAPSATEAQRLENERKAAQLEEDRRKFEEEKRQAALERQRIESQKAQVQAQVAPDNRRRLALVIGNDNYSSMPRLNNAVNDAKSMSDALKQANFEVMSYNNLDKRRMEEVLRNFTGKLGRDDVGLFYFSGHGIQADNRNFLIPVAENVKKTSEVPYEGIDVNRVMDNLKDAKNALNIVVLDACRSSLPDARGGMSRGLTVTDAPQGSIIAYATSPGKTASDGEGGNSPYTKSLIKAMQRKGVKIEDVFKEVRQSVIRDTNGEQTPSETSYLVGDFYFRP